MNQTYLSMEPPCSDEFNLAELTSKSDHICSCASAAIPNYLLILLFIPQIIRRQPIIIGRVMTSVFDSKETNLYALSRHRDSVTAHIGVRFKIDNSK